MAPLLKQRLIWRAAGYVAADRHGAEGAAMIALAAGNHAIAIGLADFEKILARKLDGSFGGFGAARGEVDAAAMAKIRRRESEKARGEFFGRSRVKLGGVSKGELRGLFGHSAANFGDAVADVDNGGLAGSIQKLAAVF